MNARSTNTANNSSSHGTETYVAAQINKSEVCQGSPKRAPQAGRRKGPSHFCTPSGNESWLLFEELEDLHFTEPAAKLQLMAARPGATEYVS